MRDCRGRLSSTMEENLRAYSVVSSINLRAHSSLALVVVVGAFSELLQTKGQYSMPVVYQAANAKGLR